MGVIRGLTTAVIVAGLVRAFLPAALAADVRPVGPGTVWHDLTVVTNSLQSAANFRADGSIVSTSVVDTCLAILPDWSAWQLVPDGALDIWVDAVADGSNTVTIRLGQDETPALTLACATDWTILPGGDFPTNALYAASDGPSTKRMTWLLSASLLLLGLSGLLRLIETGWFRRTYQDARARLRRAPRGLVLVFSLLLAWAIAFGGGKPSGQSSTPPVPPAAEVTPLPVDDDLVVFPEGQAPVQLEVPEDTDAVPVDVPSWPTEAPASNLLAAASPPLAPDTMLSGSSNLARRDFPETPFEAPEGLARWPFDAFTSNAIVGMVAAAQPPIPDVMLATGLALHRVATNQTLLTDEGGVSVHDWTRHGADNRAVWVDTPFPVVIGTSNNARVGILSNGRLAFGYGTYHRRTSTGLPIDTPYPVVTVAPLWGPFALLPTTSRVWARSECTNAFVIAWEAMLLGGSETHPATAQCVIGRDGTFRFLYGPQPIGAGNLTTVGAQNQDYGWCYSNSHSNRVQEAMAVSLRPAALDGWAYADPDGDSISNYEEFMLGTDPALGDSDGDGPSDRWELEHGFDPMVAQLADQDPDTDGDLIPDGWEAWLFSDPNNPFSGPAFVKDNDLDGFANVYEAALFDYPWDSGPQAPGPVDEDHVDVIAVVDSTRPCVLTITGPDQWIDIPWVPGVSHENVRLRLKRGAQYQVVLSRAPAGSGLATNGFWWANVRFEAPPEFWGLNGPETVADGVLAYNAHTVRIETPFRPAYDIWLVPGTTGLPVFDLAAIRLLIDGPLVFCHNTTVGEIALTADSLVTGPVDWTGLPPVTPAQVNPLVFDPSTVTPGAYTVVATAADNPWAWAECQVEIHSLAFAESVIWLSASDTTTHTIALAPGSFPTSGLYIDSIPTGIDSLNITPSELEPGIYTVYTWGACGGAEVQVNILSVEFDNVWDRNLEHEDDDEYPEYRKCIAIEHNSPSEVNLTNYLSIAPSSLTFEDIKDHVSFVVEHQIFSTATIKNISCLDYRWLDPDDVNIYAFGVQLFYGDSVVDRLIVVVYSPQSATDWNTWLTLASMGNGPGDNWLAELPPIYSALSTNNTDPEPTNCVPQQWGEVNINLPAFYHFNASSEMRSVPTAGGHGHQACYDENGALIVPGCLRDTASSGTADHRAPSIWNPTGHWTHDVRPFIRAVQMDGNPIDGEDWDTGLSHPLIRIGTHLQDYYTRRPAHTASSVAHDVCCDPAKCTVH